MKKIFKIFEPFDVALWSVSIVTIIITFCLSPKRDYITLVSSLVGVTSLIFIAKGHVAGQFLLVVFAVFYGIVSYFIKYYGEMITYLGMSAPVAIVSIVTWLRHPYKKSRQVAVAALTKQKLIIVAVLTAAVTTAFYFILRACGTAKLPVATLSVATSFFAASLAVLRSPFYAIAYAVNDVVLIVLWIMAAMADISDLPMVICFMLFLANDINGFVNWLRMKKRQQSGSDAPPQTDIAQNTETEKSA